MGSPGELHDIAGHRLTALSLNLQVLQRTAPAPLRERIDAAHTLADDLLAEYQCLCAGGRSAVGAVREPQVMIADLEHVALVDPLVVDPHALVVDAVR